MKKIFLSLALAISMMASAQVFEVGQLTKLNTPTDTDVKVAGVSADGSYVLITNGANQGLRRYDVATGKTTTITTADGASAVNVTSSAFICVKAAIRSVNVKSNFCFIFF